MNRLNMNDWIKNIYNSDEKKALPILSFPCVSLLGISVKELISDSQRQAEGMFKVAKRVNSLASVSLMDLSVEAECFGAEIKFSDDEVPTVVGRLVNDMDEAEKLAVPEIGSGRSAIYIEAIKKAKELITDRPVLAGVIGPFSLAARLLDVSEIMIDCYDDPDMVNTVLEKATAFLIKYIKAYKEVGANGVVMAEPVSGMLSPALESEFSAPFVKKIIDEVQDDEFIVVYHNCGDNTLVMTDSIFSTGAAAYHFGNSIEMEEMLKKAPCDVMIMGNVDPVGAFRLGTVEDVRESTLKIMDKCCKYQNFVISSGCDIPPLTPWENIDAFFAAVEEYYAK